MIRKLMILVVAMLVISSCSEDSTETEIPVDENWSRILSGEFTAGQDNEMQLIDYDYEIMKYNVTNEQFVGFLQGSHDAGDVWIEDSDVYGYYEGDDFNDAGNYSYYDLNDGDCRIFWDGSVFTIEDDYEYHPVVEVTWFGADAYAKYHDWRLPTREEWEKAARGTSGYDYPWGNEIDSLRANYLDSGDPWDNGTTPIGYYNGENGTNDSTSPYGCYDMCGNVWDWTATWKADSDNTRILLGGAWSNAVDENYLCSWSYGSSITNYSHENRSFRCVRDM